MIIAVLWSSLCLHFWNKLGEGVVRWWEFGLVAGITCLLLILATLFVKAVRQFPINWIVYILFTLSFAHLCAFLTCYDKTRLFYFGLWVLTAAVFGLWAYSLSTVKYMQMVPSVLCVIGPSLVVLVAFLVFTDIGLFKLCIVFLPVVLFGIYLAYDCRR